MKEDITFQSQGHRLIGTLYKAPHEKASALLIAGGANTHRHNGYYPPWQEFLLERGVTTFNFDFRGVGDSEGQLAESSLDTRVEDARAALVVLKEHSDTSHIYIVGVSMGGPIAIRIADASIAGILLAVPAAYSADARDKHFGPAFSEAIRRPESWKRSPDLEEFKQYTGRTFVLYADRDEVIPSGISLSYAETVQSKDGKVVVLENAGHRSWKDEQREYALGEMSDFILGQA